MYARTSFRGVKTCKIGKQGYVLGHIDKFWRENDGQIKGPYADHILIPQDLTGCSIFFDIK